MSKLLVLSWPLLVVAGILFVTLIDQGRGLDSPGIWLIPIGVIGIILTSIKNGRARYLRSMGVVWLLTLVSVLGLYNSWFTESYDGFIWIFPVVGFGLAGIVLICIEAYKNVKR